VLPSTTTKGAERRWPVFVLVAVVLVALALLVESFLRAESFSPGEELPGSGIQDISVSERDSLYRPPDSGRFRRQPEIIFVYLSVNDVPGVEDMTAQVERSGSTSVFSLLFGRGPTLEAVDEQEDQLSTVEGGASGIVKFALKTRSGEPVPPGNYTLQVRGSPGKGSDEGPVLARKFFIVEG
jgi:hypothetical protein